LATYGNLYEALVGAGQGGALARALKGLVNMMLRRRCLGLLAAGLMVGLGAATAGLADQYPVRPVVVIVPFAAGGSVDGVAHIVIDKLAHTLGQPFTIENVAGNGGAIGAIRTKRSAPDGYTLMLGHQGTHAAGPSLTANNGYDPVGDFEPVGLVATVPMVIISRRDLPANNLQELIALIGASGLKMGHAGVGSISYSFCTQLNNAIGIKPPMASFNGSGPAMDALVRGKIDYMCSQLVGSFQRIKDGDVKVLAVGAPERVPSLPDVPTFAEVGLAGFTSMSWNAIFAPAGTPKPVVADLNWALAKSLDDTAVATRLREIGGMVPGRSERTPEALGRLVAEDVARWKEISKSLMLR
jgi:tripartite-type tricarboxylate transporter receptor subunit TctC